VPQQPLLQNAETQSFPVSGQSEDCEHGVHDTPVLELAILDDVELAAPPAVLEELAVLEYDELAAPPVLLEELAMLDDDELAVCPLEVAPPEPPIPGAFVSKYSVSGNETAHAPSPSTPSSKPFVNTLIKRSPRIASSHPLE